MVMSGVNHGTQVKFDSFDQLIREIKADGEFCADVLTRDFTSFDKDAFFEVHHLPPFAS